MEAIAQQLPGEFGAEDFLKFLETRPDDERWQLIDGIAVMMNPPSLVHQRISMNLASLLNEAFRHHRSDLVALVEAGLSVPGRPRFLPRADVIVLDDPVDYASYASKIYLTAEVRSESNTREYIATKLERYAEHPDNLYSLIVAQREPRVEVRSRTGGWDPSVLDSLEDVLDLPAFGFRCELLDLYRGTPLA